MARNGMCAFNKAVFSIGTLGDETLDDLFWHSRTPRERLAALELMRGIVYGCDSSAARFQRVLEVLERRKG